jgi:hypothetical protein
MSAGPAAPRWLAWVCGAILAALAVAAIARDYPMVGHDYRYFIPRLIDTALHIRGNGLAIQWYSPTFGGGLPAFPNPQHLQYSLLQAATVFVNPWMAVLIVTVAAMAIGFAACFRLLRAGLGLAPFAATIGAVFFIGNGFYFEHMVVGHLGFQLFPFGAALLLILVDRERPLLLSVALFGLLTAAIVLHSGFHLIILLALSALVALLLVEASGLRRLDVARITYCALGGVGVGLVIAAPKLHAVLALMRQFPREAADVYDAGMLQALAGFAAQFGLVMTATPLLWLARLDMTTLSTALMKLTGAHARMGMWEIDTAVSPVLIVAVAAAALAAVSDGNITRAWRDPRQRIAIVALLALSWIILEMTLARGIIYPAIQRLPVMRSLHVNVRFAAVWLLPLAIIGAAMFDRWCRTGLRPRVAWLALGVAVIAPATYLVLPAHLHFRTFDVGGSIETDRRMRGGETFNVTNVMDLDDAAALSAGASSLRPYEPLFGYALETFQPQVTIGSVFTVRDGRFNMTHPASLVFPDSNNIRPFTRISEDEREALTAFTARRQPGWTVPGMHYYLVWLSLLTTIGAVMIVLFDLIVKRGDARA